VHDDSASWMNTFRPGSARTPFRAIRKYETEPVTYSGHDCMTVFYDHLASEQHRIAAILKVYHEMLPLTREAQERFDQMRACVACNKPFRT
jgi:hypothetical protein